MHVTAVTYLFFLFKSQYATEVQAVFKEFSVLLVQLMLPNIYIKFPLSTSSIASNVGSFQDM